MHEPADLGGPHDQLAQLGGAGGLEEVVLEEIFVGPEFHGFDGHVGGALPGDEDDGNAGVEGMNAAKRFQAGEVGQVDVEEDDVRMMLGNEVDTFVRRGGGQDRELRRLQDALKAEQDGRIIIDGDEMGHGRLQRAARLGRTREQWQYCTSMPGVWRIS